MSLTQCSVCKGSRSEILSRMTPKDIKKRMQELETLIRETKQRLPAHSTKPPVMMELLAYEDEYDELLTELNRQNNE